MAESKKNRFLDYFNCNKGRVLRLLKQEGEYQSFSPEHGYLYLLEVGKVAGNALMLQVGVKSGELIILDVVTAA
ncbi:hypothetical protein [Robertmurraya sp. FSL R5-0851]|uniref:hypothetical protein n=1 Tax=Robertmurraya sp. FSL R5-0851 TaxID=2921584 RepID=UPI0030FBBBC4